MSAIRNAHVIQIWKYGPPKVLTYAEVALPPLGSDEVRITATASAVNRTDLEIRAGNWPVRKVNSFPYFPAVEVIGDIEEVGERVNDKRPGQRVIAMMQGLGGVRAERPGGYAEYVTVAAAAAASVPPGLDPYDMAAIDLLGVTACEGLRRIGRLAGRRVLITGTAGGIGSAATAIARAQKASVTGLVSRSDQADHVRSLGAEEVIVSPRRTVPMPCDPGARTVSLMRLAAACSGHASRCCAPTVCCHLSERSWAAMYGSMPGTCCGP